MLTARTKTIERTGTGRQFPPFLASLSATKFSLQIYRAHCIILGPVVRRVDSAIVEVFILGSRKSWISSQEQITKIITALFQPHNCKERSRLYLRNLQKYWETNLSNQHDILN